MTAQAQVLGIFEGCSKLLGATKQLRPRESQSWQCFTNCYFVWGKNEVFLVNSAIMMFKKGVIWKNLYGFSVNYDSALTKAQKR